MILNCDICGKEVTYDWTIMTLDNFKEFLEQNGLDGIFIYYATLGLNPSCFVRICNECENKFKGKGAV